MIPPIFIITLARQTDRQHIIAARLSALGLKFEFFPASSTSTLTPENRRFYNSGLRRLQLGKDLRDTELACLHSHKRLLEKIVAENIPHAIIMEDDCVVCEDFPHIIGKLSAHADIWHLVRFFGDNKHLARRHRRLGPLVGEYSLARIATSPGGAHCYLLDTEAARRLCAALSSVTVPVDILMGRPWKTGLGVFTVYPRVAWQDEGFPSTIGHERFSRQLQVRGLEKLAFRLWAPLTRLGINIAKRWCYYSALLPDWRRARRWRALLAKGRP
ncbi:glycosyltransferase family 25 protein [Acidocella sp.]|uniref:glycosyltransferase family 25 protein n=1 Tax=Acidocella sp. TaxID=50710 RepID=UPI00262C14FC|nr:glycosyltransferase family 25 protein [Acidocella sp.]